MSAGVDVWYNYPANHSGTMCCSVLQCVALYCNLLQCVAACCLLMTVGIDVWLIDHREILWCHVLPCVAVCCSV